MSNHTKTPWTYGHMGNETLWIGPSHEELPVAEIAHDCSAARIDSRHNAAFIVRAVNSHAELVAALQSAYEAIGKLASTLRTDGRNESATLALMQQQAIHEALKRAAS